MPGADHPPIGELLELLADTLIDEERWWGPAHLVKVEIDPEAEAFEVGFKDLDGHPLDDLLGFTAPDTWHAIGVACVGWGARYDEADEEMVHRGGYGPRRPSQDPQRRRVRQVTLVGRDGTQVDRMRMQGDATTSHPSVGAVPDTLRRCLDVPTAPPPAPVGEFVAALWLERIAAMGRPGGRSLTWPDVERLRPTLADRPPAHWDELRLLVATGRLVVDDMPAALAAWADGGFCSRWLLARRLPTHALATRAEACLSGADKRRLRAAVDALVAEEPAA